MAKNQKSEEVQIEPETSIEVQTEAKIEALGIERAQIRAEVLASLPAFTKAFQEAISPIMPADLSTLKEALKGAEEAHTKAMEGDSTKSPKENILAYEVAKALRDDAQKALKSAESMTGEESLTASLKAHNYLVALHQEVADFDTKHGISYSLPSKKGRKSSANGVTRAEFESIPKADRTAFNMSLSEDGTMMVNGHSCRTMSTWKRHAEA